MLQYLLYYQNFILFSPSLFDTEYKGTILLCGPIFKHTQVLKQLECLSHAELWFILSCIKNIKIF